MKKTENEILPHQRQLKKRTFPTAKTNGRKSFGKKEKQKRKKKTKANEGPSIYPSNSCGVVVNASLPEMAPVAFITSRASR